MYYNIICNSCAKNIKNFQIHFIVLIASKIRSRPNFKCRTKQCGIVEFFHIQSCGILNNREVSPFYNYNDIEN